MQTRNLLFLIFIVVSPHAHADRDSALHAYHERDFATALYQWGILAIRDDAEAEFMLGAMYEHGEGVPAQPERAANWYRKAADQAYAPAQYALGMMYAEGRGILQDYVAAHMWLDLASKNGNADAPRQLDKLEQEMTPEQLAEARRLVKDYTSAHVLLAKVNPEDTEAAREAKVKGTVLLHVIADAAGLPRNIRVIRGLGFGLDAEAMEAAKQWKFRPGYRGGKPVAVPATIEVNFNFSLIKSRKP